MESKENRKRKKETIKTMLDILKMKEDKLQNSNFDERKIPKGKRSELLKHLQKEYNKIKV